LQKKSLAENSWESDEKTKPNFRLIKNSPNLVPPAASLGMPSEGSSFTWLPYVFGVLFAAGFLFLQKGENAKSVGSVNAERSVAQEKKAPAPSFQSPLLSTVRELGKKQSP
jgi:hypothetical protein